MTTGKRTLGPARTRLAADLAIRYRNGQSIRAIAADTNLSYGKVHDLLTEARVTFRSRGGNTRGRS